MQSAEFKIGCFLVILVVTISSACNAEPSTTRSSPAPEPIALLPQEAERITKPLNVSFSTYSRDWPVGWLWIDPDERNVRTPHDVKKTVLSLTVPTGKDLVGENRNAPRYVKALIGDFEIETRVRALPKENFQAAGLLIFSDGNNYIRLERSFAGAAGGEGLSLRVRRGDALKQLALIDVRSDLTDIKLRREGSLFSAYWRSSEELTWESVGEFRAEYPDIVLAGLAVYNTAEPFTAEFAYIRLLPVK